MNYSILALLKLQEWLVLDVSHNPKQIILTLARRRKTADCPKCDKRTRHLWQYGRWQLVKHFLLGNRQIYLKLRKRRFLCPRCHFVFTERTWLVKPYGRKTTSLDQQIITDLTDLSFKAVRRRTKVSYHAQVKVLKTEINPFLANWEEEENQEEISLGIDEVSFAGFDFLPIVANLQTKRLKAVLADDRRKTLENCLRTIPERIKSKIKEVCLDMNRNYLSSIKTILPSAKIVVDHFHVIQDANRRITEERRILQQVFRVKLPMRLFLKNKEDLTREEETRVKQYFCSFPDLKSFWEAQEALRQMYTLEEKQKAKEKLENLITALSYSDDLGLRQWGRSLFFWKEEILNYFERKTTNAYLEGLNTKIKLIKRISFGFRNKEVFIRKAILACLPLYLLPQLLT